MTENKKETFTKRCEDVVNLLLNSKVRMLLLMNSEIRGRLCNLGKYRGNECSEPKTRGRLM